MLSLMVLLAKVISRRKTWAKVGLRLADGCVQLRLEYFGRLLDCTSVQFVI